MLQSLPPLMACDLVKVVLVVPPSLQERAPGFEANLRGGLRDALEPRNTCFQKLTL